MYELNNNRAIEIIKDGNKIIAKRRNVPFDLESFHKFEKVFTQLIKEGKDLFVIYDASETNTYSTGTVRKAMSQWLKRNDDLLQNNVGCGVIIVPSLLTQLTLETALLINPLFDYKIFTNNSKAQNWIKNELKKTNL